MSELEDPPPVSDPFGGRAAEAEAAAVRVRPRVEIKQANATASVASKMHMQQLHDERMAWLENRLAARDAQLAKAQLDEIQSRGTTKEHERKEDKKQMLAHTHGFEQARYYSEGPVQRNMWCLCKSLVVRVSRLERSHA